MASGYFFSCRLESLGEALFDYTAVHRLRTEGVTRESPVYLLLREGAADFVYHGRLGSERIVRRLILRLPLGDQSIAEGSLDDVVAELYERCWPLNPSGGLPIEVKRNRQGYSLTCEPVEEGVIPLYRLLLDLLFDLEHSEVFGRHRERLVLAFRRSPVMAALMDKLEYQSSRERLLCWASLTEKGGRDEGRSDLTGALWERERAWIDRCLSPTSSEALRSRWFDPIEDEVRRVVFPQERNESGSESAEPAVESSFACAAKMEKADSRLDEMRSDRFEDVASWFLRRQDLDAFLLLLLRGFAIERILRGRWRRYLSIGVVGLLSIGPLLLVAFSGMEGLPPVRFAPLGAALVGTVGLTALCWWIARRPSRVQGPLRVSPAAHRSRGAPATLPVHPVRFMIALGVVIVSAFYSFASIGAFESELGYSLRLAYFYIALLITLTTLVALVLRRSRPGIFGRTVFGLFRLALPRMFLAIAAAWTLMMTTEEVVKANLLVGWKEILLVCTPLVALAWIFTAVEVQTRIDFPRRALGRAMWLVAASLLISYGTGFFMTNLVMPRYLMLSGFLNSTEFAVRASEFGGSNESPREIQTHGEAIERLEGLRWGQTAAWPGIRVLYAADVPWGQIYFFPGLHLYTACFAMFVGVFFTLVLGGRSLTESLRDPAS